MRLVLKGATSPPRRILTARCLFHAADPRIKDLPPEAQRICYPACDHVSIVCMTPTPYFPMLSSGVLPRL